MSLEDQRDQLVSVLDGSDNEILVGTAKLVASLIQDGLSNNVVGTQTSGFFNSPTVNFNVPIPAGTTYRVYYGSRTNLATLPLDALTSIKIRGAQEIEASVERVLRDLHSTAVGTNWDDPWIATVNSLARTGLDGRYRLSTADPGASPALNTPGNGGTILRDGPAPAISYPSVDLTATGTVGVSRYPDALLAAWRVRRASPIVGTTYNSALGGDHGLVQESTYHNYVDSAEVAFTHVTNSLLLDVVPRSITASTLGGQPVLSRINAAAVASVNPSAGTDATSRRTIQLAAGDFIRNASGHIGVRVTDLLEVTDNVTSLMVGTFRLDAILTDSSFTVKTVTGAIPPLGPSGAAAAIKVRWLQTAVSVGGQNLAGVGGVLSGIPSMFVAQPGLLTDDPNSNAVCTAAMFLAAMSQRTLGAVGDSHFQALQWGGFDTTGNPALFSSLLGDGGIDATAGRHRFNLICRKSIFSQAIANGGGTVSWEPYTFGSSVNIYWTAGLTSDSPIVFTVNTVLGYVPKNGDQFTVMIQIAPSTSGKITITWPGTFIFSGDDGVIPPYNFTGEFIIVRYLFEYQTTPAGGGWWATRTDY